MTSTCKTDKKQSKTHYTLHPYELAFVGFSNSGKTTLIESLVHKLKDRFSIGYLKSDAHSFAMDQPGKDTQRIYAAGATSALIHGEDGFASNSKLKPSEWKLKEATLDYDCLFVEGWKTSKLPKIVVLNNNVEIWKQLDIHPNVRCIVYSSKQQLPGIPESLAMVPLFHRDEIEKLVQWIKEYYQSISAPLNALILAGGQSIRMGKDKASLQYQKSNQALHLKTLLNPFCENVYLSRNPEQAPLGFPTEFCLPDVFQNMGPVSGILSAFRFNLNSAWLVVACDLPYLDESTLENLIQQRKSQKFATCYLDSAGKFPEPLCTIFEPKFYGKALQFLAQGYACPRKALLNTEIALLGNPPSKALHNVNTPVEYQEVKNVLCK